MQELQTILYLKVSVLEGQKCLIGTLDIYSKYRGYGDDTIPCM